MYEFFVNTFTKIFFFIARKNQFKMEKLEKWINSNGGVAQTAKLLGIQRATIYMWLWRKTLPRVGTALKIVKLSKGKIQFQDLVTRQIQIKK